MSGYTGLTVQLVNGCLAVGSIAGRLSGWRSRGWPLLWRVWWSGCTVSQSLCTLCPPWMSLVYTTVHTQSVETLQQYEQYLKLQHISLHLQIGAIEGDSFSINKREKKKCFISTILYIWSHCIYSFTVNVSIDFVTG